MLTLNRNERQKECVINWKKANGHATITACTGFGKTTIALNIINKFLTKNPDFNIVVVVPTTTLKEQWEKKNDKIKVYVINTIVLTPLHLNCDLLIIDEIHRMASTLFSQVFSLIKYKYILGLTATLERLDGKEYIIKQYCPVCDQVLLADAMFNNWVSHYKEYLVLINVDDINTYKELNNQFIEHFGYFSFNWELAMSMIGPKGVFNRIKFRDKLCPNDSKENKSKILKEIIYHATSFMRVLQKRKTFINNHPKKLELTNKIIKARSDKKIITFSNNIKMAESIEIGKAYSGKDTKKKGRATLEEIRTGKIQVLNTVSKANEGLDISDLSVAIMLGIDSSKIKAIQRVGRVIRYEENKEAEIFNLIINNTAELEWFKKAHANSSYIVIDEEELDKVLNNETFTPKPKYLKESTFRY